MTNTSKTHDAREIAIWIASDPEYQHDENAEVALWVDTWTSADGLDDDAYAALLDEVLSELRFAEPDPAQTAQWIKASRDHRACERAERFVPFGTLA